MKNNDSINIKNIKEEESVTLFIEKSDYFSYTSLSNNKNVISNIKIRNNSKKEDLINLKLKIYIDKKSDDYFKIEDIYIPLIKKKEILELNDIDIIYNSIKFLSLKNNTKITISIELINEYNSIIYYQNEEITLVNYKYFNISYHSLEMLGKYVTPNSIYTKNNVFNAKKEIVALKNKEDYLGYLNEEDKEIDDEVRSVYNYLSYLKIRETSFTLDRLNGGINIRLGSDIYLLKMANSLELSLFFASTLEYIKLNPMIIFFNDEIYLGYWKLNDNFISAVYENYSLFFELLMNNKIEVLSIKRFLNGASFIDNLKNAKEYFKKELYKLLKEEKSLIYLKNNITTKNDKNGGIKNNEEVSEDLASSFLLLDIKALRIEGIYPLDTNELTTFNSSIFELDKNVEKLENIEIIPKRRIEEVNKNKGKFDLWERKLLDLSKSNKLINMKIGTNNIEILVPSLNELIYSLSNIENTIELIPNSDSKIPSSSKRNIYEYDQNNKEIKELVGENLVNNKLILLLNEKEYSLSVPSLYHKARNDMEESGTNTLFIALGIIKWKENKRSKVSYYAPLLLYPINIIKRFDKKYFIKGIDEEPFINTTFINFLKEEFNINIDLTNSNLPKKKEDSDLIDINEIIFKVKKEITNYKEIELLKNAFIGRFSFSKYIMWNDIEQNKEKILKNRVIKSFINNKKEWKSPETIDVYKIDEEIKLKDLAIPLSADSTQLKAIIDASLNESFVMIGPPGTGKSQTIANIIVNSLFNGKKILFCSEKKAALDVVYSRLKEIRIDPFCLELHSQKQDKRAVLSTFERVLDLGEIERNKDYEKIVEENENLKNILKDIVIKIHSTKRYGISLYDAILEYEKYKDIEENVDINDTFLKTLNNSKLEEINSLFDRGENYSLSFKPYKENPFRVYSLRSYSNEDKEKLKDLLFNLNDSLNTFNFLSRKLNKSISIESFDEKTLDELSSIFEYLKKRKVYFELLKTEDYLKVPKKMKELVVLERDTNVEENILFTIFNKNIMNEDFESLINEYKKYSNANFLVKFFKLNNILSKVKKYAYKSKTINTKNLLDYLERFNKFSKNLKLVTKNKIIVSSTLKSDYSKSLDNENNYPYIIDNIDNTITLGEKILKISYGNNKPFKLTKYIEELFLEEASKNMIDEYMEKYDLVKSNLVILINDYKFNLKEIRRYSSKNSTTTNSNNNFFEELNEILKDIYKNINLVYEYTSLLNIFDRFISLNLSDIINKYKDEGLSFKYIKDIFHKSLAKKIIDSLIKEYDLEEFLGKDYSMIKDNYLLLDNRYKKEVINEVVSKLSKNIPSVYSSLSKTSEIGILKKAIKSGGRGMSLRNILSLIPLTIQKLTPCILTSPLSCAKYLDSDLYNFDVVIFDEASQLPTSDALGAILRGKSVVISGDDKQLPPTSFFDKSINEEKENIEIQDLESILDDALAASFPINKLSYHYRSKDESLIAFSNSKFYGNSLFTFPSINKIKSKVSFKYVENGIYDAGKSATNKEEARVLVNDILERIKNNPKNLSFGIITFSIRQMELIERLLEEKVDKDEELYNLVNSLKEPLFIKNLENVQGDERDVIYLSICYGRNKNGRLIHNFGPINILGGYRRLNVAITRSRDEMYVYSSITYRDINLNRTNSEGVRYLKSFLEYSEHGMKTLTTLNSSYLIKDGIEEYIAKELKALGHEVTLHLGVSRFKIDIAVSNPNDNNKYLLGIILDSYNYSLTPTVKDRNIIQIEELKKLGWNILFVWSLSYYNDPINTIKEIDEKIKELASKDLVDNKEGYDNREDFSTIEFKKTIKKTTSHLKAYSFFTLKNLYNEKMLINPHNRQSIYKLVKNLIDVEYPISEKLLIKRISELFQIERKNKENTSIIRYFISKLNNYYDYSYNENIKFFYKDGILDSKEINFYRKANNRDILDISKEEIAVLIKEILEKEVSMEKENLKRIIVKRLGFKSKTRKIDLALDYVFEYLAKEKIVLLKENNYIELIKQ